MFASLLSNYLLSNRKRLRLTQEDVAFLLGAKSGETVSRHERFAREPSLRTAFAYEAIYRRSASELFGGLYGEIECQVAARAKALLSSPAFLSEGQDGLRRQSVAIIAGEAYE